jgi:hypothetical protein
MHKSCLRALPYLGTGQWSELLLRRMDQRHQASTRQVRRWLGQEGVALAGYDIDHIVPRCLGGLDHPYNYCIVPTGLNRRWGPDWTPAKRAALGRDTVKPALAFAQWSRAQARQARVPLNRFEAPGRLS